MPAFLCFLILLAGAVALTVQARHDPALYENWKLHLLMFPPLALLGGWTMGAMVESWGLLGYISMFLVGIAWSPLLSGALSHYLGVSLPGWLVGDRKLKLPVTFDRGDAAMKRGDPVLALREYAAELERHPDAPDLFLRMADAHQAAGDAAQRLSCLREAVRIAKDPHRRGPILLLVSEALGKAGDEAGRREALKSVLADPALSDYHAAARARNP